MLKRNGLRILTTGEISLAKELFSSSILYNKVWVHHGSYLPFNLQDKDTAMTPNGEIWFETNVYHDDFSQASVRNQLLFLHEMMHVWQHQKGMLVRTRGLLSWAADYYYLLNKSKLSDYSMEQQAGIVADYWVLMRYGVAEYATKNNNKGYNSKVKVDSLIENYQRILRGFPQ
ncbi:type IV secretion protein Rhs [Rouxiella sp. Mn2063]|uniref:type IV secretion protein Rhs n=1 Tax=Rouxiella sp. Mn2063 TaxID=3395262 RepID=UPI003BC6C63D